MHLKNLSLAKEYAKSLEKNYFITCDPFKSDLQQVEYFYPTRPISRDQVLINQMMEDKNQVFMADFPDASSLFFLMCLYLMYLYFQWISKFHGSYFAVCILILVSYHYFTSLYNISLSHEFVSLGDNWFFEIVLEVLLDVSGDHVWPRVDTHSLPPSDH